MPSVDAEQTERRPESGRKNDGHDPSLWRRLVSLPRPIWVICGGVFLNKLGNFLSVFLILYLTSKGYSPFQAGLALGAIGLGSFFGNAVGGTVADRFGRRPTIVISMVGAAGLTPLIPVSSNLYTTIVLAVAIGLFARLFNPAAGAILVDSVRPDQLVTSFGMYRLAINVGMSIGAVLGGALAAVNFNYLFIGNSVASGLFGLVVFLLLPETSPKHHPGRAGTAERPGGYRDVFSDRTLVLYVVTIVVGTYVYTQTTSTLSLQVRDLHLGSSFYGILLGINAVLCVLIELPLIKFTAHRHPGRILAVGLALQAIGVGLTGVAHDRVGLLFTVLLWSFGETVYSPVAQAIPGMLAPDHLRGRYQGAEGIAATIGQTVGPALGGLLYAVSSGMHWLICGVAGFAAAGVFLAAGDLRERAQQREEHRAVKSGQFDSTSYVVGCPPSEGPL